MKKIIIYLFFTIFISACFNSKKKYNDNLITFQNLVSDINNFFIDSTDSNIKISDYYSDDFIFHSYTEGHKKGIKTFKKEYINGFNQMKKLNMSLNINHSIYLPGLDENSYKINGSVRSYYGATIKIDTAHIEFSGYQTINFKNGQITGIWEWADYGGVQNKIKEYTQ
jgi:hypothetical protein